MVRIQIDMSGEDIEEIEMYEQDLDCFCSEYHAPYKIYKFVADNKMAVLVANIKTEERAKK